VAAPESTQSPDGEATGEWLIAGAGCGAGAGRSAKQAISTSRRNRWSPRPLKERSNKENTSEAYGGDGRRSNGPAQPALRGTGPRHLEGEGRCLVRAHSPVGAEAATMRQQLIEGKRQGQEGYPLPQSG